MKPAMCRANPDAPVITILGGSGFIGGHLVTHLKHEGLSCAGKERDDPALFREHLGHVIYCAGVTADFREKPFETVDAHVSLASKLLRDASWDSFLYLSSTRVYSGATGTGEEQSLTVSPLTGGDLYNISKLMGESLCFVVPRPTVRVVRLSNVYGCNFDSRDFLPSMVREAAERRYVLLNTSFDSEKDYIAIDDVVRLLPRISMSGRHRLYNVASGVNTSNRTIAQLLQQKTGCTIEVAAGAGTVSFPRIAIARIQEEFPFQPRSVIDAMDDILVHYHEWKAKAQH
jgi:nucleoside-diphosphate-sugar epimerase